MVQVLPPGRQKQTLGQKLNRAVGVGLDKAQELYDKRQHAQALKEYGIDPNLSPEMQKVALAESLKGQRKDAELEKKFQLLGGLFEKQQPSASSSESDIKNPYREEMLGPEEGEPQKSTKPKKGFRYSDIPKEKRAQFAIADPQASKALEHMADVETREAREEKKADEKRKNDLRRETLPYRQQLAERAEIAQRDLESKKESLELIKNGQINHPMAAIFLENLPGKFGLQFLSPETLQYKASLVQGYGGLKNLFSGATRVKEIEILENKIADTYLTDDQKLAVINSMSRASQQELIQAEAAQEVEAESEGRNEPLGILEFRKKTQQRAKEKSDALFNRILDDQEAIFKDAENIKKMPLEYENPEHRSIIDQIIGEARQQVSNPKDLKLVEKKAMEIAKKKGYHW